MPPFPSGSRGPILPAETTCIEAGCERYAIVAGTRCRLHLVEALRIEGTAYLPDDPERAEMFAAIEQIVEVALADLPPQRQNGAVPWVNFDLYVVLPRDAELATAQLAMEVLGVGIADRFGGSRVWQPTAYMRDVMLRTQIRGPQSEEFRAALGFALAAE